MYRQHQEWADQAIAQLDSDEAFFKALGPRSHSVAVTVKHVAGNLRSRWLNFLTADGEKPDRNRDGEFIIAPEDTRTRLMKAWSDSWTVLYAELDGLHLDDLEKTVTIRGESLTVIKAIQRSLAHTAYHVGQILLSLPPPQSRRLELAHHRPRHQPTVQSRHGEQGEGLR